MKKFKSIAIAISGCSTIVSKSSYPVAITSNPPSADFVIENKAGKEVHSGITPETIILKASAGSFQGETYKLILNKDGFDERTLEIDSTVDGWYFGNLIIGGLLGLLIIDPISGAMFSLPEKASGSLRESVKKGDVKTLTVAMLDTIPMRQRAELIPLN